MARAMTIGALIPVVGAPLALVLFAFRGSVLSLLAAGAVAVVMVLRWPEWTRRAWWRLWWPLDARAGGLVVLAEPGVDGTYNPADGLVEVAPIAWRVVVHEHGRRYIVRPLPGQSLSSFSAAAEALRWRWRCSAVNVSAHPTRRGLVVVDVATGGSDLTTARGRPR